MRRGSRREKQKEVMGCTTESGRVEDVRRRWKRRRKKRGRKCKGVGARGKGKRCRGRVLDSFVRGSTSVAPTRSRVSS